MFFVINTVAESIMTAKVFAHIFFIFSTAKLKKVL